MGHRVEVWLERIYGVKKNKKNIDKTIIAVIGIKNLFEARAIRYVDAQKIPTADQWTLFTKGKMSDGKYNPKWCNAVSEALQNIPGALLSYQGKQNKDRKIISKLGKEIDEGVQRLRAIVMKNNSKKNNGADSLSTKLFSLWHTSWPGLEKPWRQIMRTLAKLICSQRRKMVHPISL